jgi:quinol monooxygenase YgiN
MSVPVLIGFAGVLVAAVATGMLAGRCVRQPAPGFVGLAVAALALTIALAAQSLGFESGFGPATFRAVQLCALLLAPLGLAWGLAELTWPSDGARFGARLGAGALTVVGGVILATDPLIGPPFSKAWPLPGAHDDVVAHYLLDWVQAVTIVVTLASLGLAVRARDGRPRGRTLLGLALIGVAVGLTAALRLSLPDRSLYPLLTLAAAALVWFGTTRIAARPARGRMDRGRMDRDRMDRDRMDRDRTARDRVDGDRIDRGLDTRREGGRRAAADEYDGREAMNGSRDGGLRDARDPRDPRDLRDPRDPRDLRAPGVPVGPGAWGGPGARDERGLRAEPGRRPAAPVPPPDWYPPETDGRASTAPPGPAAAAAVGLEADGIGFGPDAAQAGAPGAAPGRPYGRILIFTLLEDRTADFDRLAEQAAEEVRTGEPGTLVYVIHLVPNAPLQRIFYEIYADRAAFDSHENQPYMQRFVAERRACVLATNVIELRLKWAKVAPLPSPQQAGPRPAGPAPTGPTRIGPLPPGPAPQRPQALEPLPPRPDRGLRPADRRYGGS